MSRVTFAPLALSVVVLWAPGQQGQQQQQQPPSFRAGVETVAIYATVTDGSGRLVPDLRREDFEVYDDDRPQELTLFKSDIQPITVVVMLDTSGSMTLDLDLLKAAAESFVIRLLPDDRARIGSFNDKIILSPFFTNDRDELIRVLHNDIQFGNPTRLWDAVDKSMTALSQETGRRVVLVFTDGEDMQSREYSLNDLLKRAQDEDFMVYAIGLRTQLPGMPASRPDRGLKRLAEETGGGYFELERKADLNSTFTRVADELHRQYVLGFSPERRDGKTHKLDVRVTRNGMTARARKSYVASGSR